MRIAVDFDGTLCEHKFPEIGEIKPKHQIVIDFIKNEKKLGSTIILWTCREDTKEGQYLTKAVCWCKKHNIPIDYINEDPSNNFYGNGIYPRKIYADLYIDDKAINVKEFEF